MFAYIPMLTLGSYDERCLNRSASRMSGSIFLGFDPDLSLKIQLDEGLKVIGSRRELIHHEQHHDDYKIGDLSAGREDNTRLFAKWNVPEAGAYANPTPD